MAGLPTRPGRQYSKADLEHAGNDARTLISSSAILKSFITLDILGRQLYLVARSAIENEVCNGWDVVNPQLVLQTLAMSAQEKSIEPITMQELLQLVKETAVPVLEVLAAQEQEAASGVAVQESSNDDNGDTSEDAGNEVAGAGSVLPGGGDEVAAGLV